MERDDWMMAISEERNGKVTIAQEKEQMIKAYGDAHPITALCIINCQQLFLDSRD